MERPGNLEPRTVSIMLVVVSSLLFLFEIIALATPWYAVIFGNNGGGGYYYLFSVCSASVFANICLPISTAYGNAAFAFGFFALICYLVSAVFWALHTFASQVLAPLPGPAKMGMGLLILCSPILVIVSWVSWVIGFAVQANGSTSGVSGHAGLAFSIIVTLMSCVAAVLAFWNKDQLGVDISSSTPAAAAETSA